MMGHKRGRDTKDGVGRYDGLTFCFDMLGAAGSCVCGSRDCRQEWLLAHIMLKHSQLL